MSRGRGRVALAAARELRVISALGAPMTIRYRARRASTLEAGRCESRAQVVQQLGGPGITRLLSPSRCSNSSLAALRCFVRSPGLIRVGQMRLTEAFANQMLRG